MKRWLAAASSRGDMRRATGLLFIVPATIALSSCDIVSPPMCPQIVRFGITVDIRDSITDAPVGDGARIIAREGAFADTVIVPAGGASQAPYPLVEERSGIYSVNVERAGYDVWSRSGVWVRDGECGVRTVHLVARLQAD